MTTSRCHGTQSASARRDGSTQATSLCSQLRDTSLPAALSNRKRVDKKLLAAGRAGER